MQQTNDSSSLFQTLKGRAVLGVLTCALALTGTLAEAGSGPPFVEAGDDQTVNAGNIVSLEGQVQPDVYFVEYLNYYWTQISGTAVMFLTPTSGSVDNPGSHDQDPAIAKPLLDLPPVTFTAPPTAGTLVFQLEAEQHRYLELFGDDTVTITVQATATPEEDIDALIGDVQALVGAGALSGGQGNALTSKLDGALAKLADGKTQSAINKIQAFINQVQALVNGGVLDTATGQGLIGDAMVVISKIDA